MRDVEGGELQIEQAGLDARDLLLGLNDFISSLMSSPRNAVQADSFDSF